MRKENGGYAIYEVNSSTDAKHIYTVDHTFGNGFRVEYHSIMYGEEVIEYFYRKILKLVLLIEETSDKMIYIPHILKILRKEFNIVQNYMDILMKKKYD